LGVPDAAELLAAYDAQLRTHVPERLPNGARAEWDGPLLRFIGLGNRGWVLYRDLGGLDGAELDDLIARQVRVFAQRGERFEWKWHAHDRPLDLPRRLRAAGFVPEDEETVVIAAVGQIARPVRLPDRVSLREVADRSDFARIAAVQPEIWQEHEVPSWLAESLEAEKRAGPDALTVLVVEADGAVVCAAWVRFESGTDFATFWGGGTVPAWRGRGIYRATVAYRANLADERGFRFIEVDASDDSRPILERLGFVAVTTTTPYLWSPPKAGVG
jgi:GNAT superfamily N-acetyltransferase